MFDANSDINALEYDGIEQQITTKEKQNQYKSTAFAGYDAADAEDTVIIDVRGKFTDDIAEDMALRNVNNFGMAMDCYLGTDIHSDFSKEFYQKQRTLPGETLTSGNRVKEHTGTLDFRFKPSLFNRPRRTPLAVSVSASAAPTIALPVVAPDTDSEFLAADAGDYGYIMSLVYEDGETLPSTEQVATVAAGDSVSIAPTYTGTPLYANVFRTALNAAGSKWEFIGRVKLAGTGVAVKVDTNAMVPGSAKAFLLMHDTDALCWKQLGSLIKYDLAVTNTSYQWLQLLYGTPLVSAARKHVIAKNITRA